jgi:hypothetical protein
MNRKSNGSQQPFDVKIYDLRFTIFEWCSTLEKFRRTLCFVKSKIKNLKS